MVHLEVDQSIIPHVTAAQRVPVAIKSRLKTELDKLVGKKVIEPISDPMYKPKTTL